MDDWEKFNETSFSGKKDFYSQLNMEESTDSDYIHEQKICEDLQIKNLVEYQDLYDRCDTLLLADLFENFHNMCLDKPYELDHARCLTAPKLA